HVANKVLGRNDLSSETRVIYVLDLTSPNGVFVARDFGIRDQDTVYVTEAPYTQFSKVLGAIVAPVGSAASIASLGE
ncbi:MAG: polysaccharide export protein, partial [Paracoccaceae bacterium]